MIQIEFKKLDDINAAAKQFLEAVGEKKHFAFYGQMGAGKTTFIKAVCEVLRVTDVVTSPTFSIINEYHTSTDEKVYHFDFYRIEDLEEAYNLGYEDYFYSSDYCFVEWPERVEELLPEHMAIVNITVNDDESRVVSVK